MTRVYDFTVKTGNGKAQSLSKYRGQTLLIVNTASQCGFTPQYEGLQALRDAYHARGFEVLAFPCNQFGAQEPGDAHAIAQFCDLNYHIQFPVFAKIDVNGEGAEPLFQFLKRAAPGLLGSEAIKWNFTKFLVTPDGKVKRYAPQDTPASIAPDIERSLG